MAGMNEDRKLLRRIAQGQVNRGDVVRALAELAFGKANDCVRLVVEPEPCLDGLDLRLLSEVKRNEKGTVEVRLLDRLKVLEQLSRMIGEEEGDLEEFWKNLQEDHG